MRSPFALVAFLALALAACGTVLSPPTSIPAPVAAANATTLDEQAGSAVELAYKGARALVELAVDTGRLTGANAAKAQELNRKAYKAVQVARAAYRTGNAASYTVAAKEARSLVSQMLALI